MGRAVTAPLLLTHLQFAVPLEIRRLLDMGPDDIAALADTLRDRLQFGADTMLFGGGQPGEAARATADWTRALAVLAVTAEGGVDFAGLHWCADPACRATTRYDHAGDTVPPPRNDPPPPRAITDLPDISTYREAS